MTIFIFYHATRTKNQPHNLLKSGSHTDLPSNRIYQTPLIAKSKQKRSEMSRAATSKRPEGSK